MKIDMDREEFASTLRGSLQEFIKFFLKYLTQRDYIVSNPKGRESHQIIICRELTKVTRMEYPDHNVLINVEPGSGKSLHLCMWVAWCFAQYPDCNFIYTSYSHTLAAAQTNFIKQIMGSDMYRYLFHVELAKDSRAKDHFTTTAGGEVAAFGTQGAITGRNAGLPGLDRFSGALIMDDSIKPDDATSDVIRENVKRNYEETIRQRPRGKNVPIVSIGQRVHEDDPSAFFIADKDTKPWKLIILESIDAAGNALYPEVHDEKFLAELKEKSPYVYACQFQQNPLPAGGSLFKPEWIVQTDFYPEIIKSFVTCDTAETQKSYNDASVFSFWGLYEIESFGRKTGLMGLHWIDCVEMRIEPKDLKDAFLDFWQDCNRFKIPPQIAAIEKKSTGVTLISVLSEIRGIAIRDIQRTRASGSKTERFLRMQPYLAGKQISINADARHKQMCLDHISKITANETHRFDDVCFIANTKIATLFGDKNIQDVVNGDHVITPFGLGKVIDSRMTNRSAQVITRHGLTGTKNHPIYSKNKFIPMDTLHDDAMISALTMQDLIKWKYQKILCSMGSYTGSWGRAAITLASKKTIKKERILKDCMWRFGSFIAARQYLTAMLFIIKTGTALITTFAIWNVYRISNTCRTIVKQSEHGESQINVESTLQKLKKRQSYGIKAKKVGNGIGKMVEIAFASSKTTFAKSAESLIPQQWQQEQNFVVKNAMEGTGAETYQLTPTFAKYAKQNLRQRSKHHPLSKENVVLKNAHLSCQQEPVYNITIETYGVYYANGILVSNCDTLADAIQIALIEKQIVADHNAKHTDNEKMDKLRSAMLDRIQARSN